MLGYGLPQALIYVALLVPSHLYELLPIAVLIGTIFVMARLAQSSEYTILRTSGLGPVARAAHAAGAGRWLRGADLRRSATTWRPSATARRSCSRRATRAYYAMAATPAPGCKERQGDKSYAVNVRVACAATARCKHPRIFEFDTDGFLVVADHGASGPLRPDGAWMLQRRRAQRVRHPRPDDKAAVEHHASSPTCAGPPAHRTRWCRWRCSSPTA